MRYINLGRFISLIHAISNENGEIMVVNFIS